MAPEEDACPHSFGEPVGLAVIWRQSRDGSSSCGQSGRLAKEASYGEKLTRVCMQAPPFPSETSWLKFRKFPSLLKAQSSPLWNGNPLYLQGCGEIYTAYVTAVSAHQVTCSANFQFSSLHLSFSFVKNRIFCFMRAIMCLLGGFYSLFWRYTRLETNLQMNVHVLLLQLVRKC